MTQALTTIEDWYGDKLVVNLGPIPSEPTRVYIRVDDVDAPDDKEGLEVSLNLDQIKALRKSLKKAIKKIERR